MYLEGPSSLQRLGYHAGFLQLIFFLELFSGHDVFRLTSICGIPWRTPSHSPHYLPVKPRVGLGMCNSCLAH